MRENRFSRNMAHLEIIIGISAVPWLPLWYFLFESPRWLLAKGRKKEASIILKNACKHNKANSDELEEFIKNFTPETTLNIGFKDLFLSQSIRRNTIIMSFCWLSFSMGYFGLLYNTPALNWNPFLVFVFPAFIVSIIALFQPFLENKLGRKVLLTTSLLLAGSVLLMTSFFDKTNSGAIISCAWIGTVACSVAFGVGYTFTKELYPTMMRTTALSTASAAARIGSIVSPFIGMLDSVSEVLPLVAYGAVVFGAGIASFWIWPETKKVRLPDTIEECERLASSKNTWIICNKK